MSKLFHNLVRNSQVSIHALAYSFIGFQVLYLATHWNPIYWNTSCLIVNSGSLEENEENDIDEEEDEKTSKKTSNTDYAKMSKAIGEIMSKGILVSLVDINKSELGFVPNVKDNKILFGFKGITNINNNDMIKQIIANRPYNSIEDFLSKNKIDKRAMINLIKSGAFDSLYPNTTREEIMKEYIHSISKEKQKLNLQNFNGLIENNLVPPELQLVVQTYKFTKILKKYFKSEDNFKIENEQLLTFYLNHFDDTYLINGNEISQKIYDKQIYQPMMDKAREWLRDNQQQVLTDYNHILFSQEWDKYCLGNISSWEMDSISFYYHDHELKNVNKNLYGVDDFFSLPEQPIVDYTFVKNGKTIPLYKLTRIIGTVIGKNKTKGTLTLLTTQGVVNVRFRKEMFAFFDKQISIKQEDGTKKVIEKSWFKKGNKIMLNGFRREDQFVVKKYAKTKGHQIYLITDVREDGSLALLGERTNIESED